MIVLVLVAFVIPTAFCIGYGAASIVNHISEGTFL